MTPDLVPLIHELTDLVRGPAVLFEIVSVGQPAIPDLVRLLHGPTETVYQPRCLAADALAAIGASDELMHALADSIARGLDPILRQAEDVVASTIAEHLAVVDEPRVRDALLAALSIRPVTGCISALGHMHEPRAVTAIVRALGDDSLRDTAVDALRKFGVEALSDITRVATYPRRVQGIEPPVWIDARIAAVALLAALDHESTALPLVWLLGDDQRRVREAAALAVATRGIVAIEIAMPILVSIVIDGSWPSAERAADFLSVLGAALEPALSDHLADRALPRDAAIRIESLLGRAGIVAPLAAMHAHPDRHVRWHAIDVLARIAAWREIVAFLADRSRELRDHAIDALSGATDVATLDAILREVALPWRARRVARRRLRSRRGA